jgi:hypothetical protein
MKKKLRFKKEGVIKYHKSYQNDIICCNKNVLQSNESNFDEICNNSIFQIQKLRDEHKKENKKWV